MYYLHKMELKNRGNSPVFGNIALEALSGSPQPNLGRGRYGMGPPGSKTYKDDDHSINILKQPTPRGVVC